MKKHLPLLIAVILLLPVSVAAQTVLDNPIGTSDLRVVVGRIIKALLGLSGTLALLMFVWGGFQWITSGGEKEKIDKGKRTLTWAVIGLFFIFISYTAVSALISAITTGSAEPAAAEEESEDE